MVKPGETGLKRIISATRYSIQGFKACWRMEAAFRQEILACIILVPLALLLGENSLEKAILITACLLVPIIELLNSAIEAVVDRVGSEHHDLSGVAKDLGSAAVFMSIVLFIAVWTLLICF